MFLKRSYLEIDRVSLAVGRQINIPLRVREESWKALFLSLSVFLRPVTVHLDMWEAGGSLCLWFSPTYVDL